MLLTDLHPGTAGAQLPARVAAHPESVNACAVPAELVGIRTIFDGFHHLRPEVGEAVLKDAVDQGVPIGVFEVVERNVLAMLGMVLLVPVAVWILTPFVRPFTWWRLLLTYIVPVAPAAVTFDGVVSCMRVYEVPELEAMSARADPERAFEWRTWEQKDGLMTVTALIGRPAVSTP